jgi:hypothetical protein
MATLKLVKRDGLKHAALNLAARAEAPRQIFGDANGDFRELWKIVVHVLFLSRGRLAGQGCASRPSRTCAPS